jgi:hypothetical protein
MSLQLNNNVKEQENKRLVAVYTGFAVVFVSEPFEASASVSAVSFASEVLSRSMRRSAQAKNSPTRDYFSNQQFTPRPPSTPAGFSRDLTPVGCSGKCQASALALKTGKPCALQRLWHRGDRV